MACARIFLDARHLLRPRRGNEANVFCIALRFNKFQQLVQFKARPGHIHRPRLNATEAIRPLLMRETFAVEQVINAEFTWLVAEPRDLNGPWIGRQFLCQFPDT